MFLLAPVSLSQPTEPLSPADLSEVFTPRLLLVLLRVPLSLYSPLLLPSLIPALISPTFLSFSCVICPPCFSFLSPPPSSLIPPLSLSLSLSVRIFLLSLIPVQ